MIVSREIKGNCESRTEVATGASYETSYRSAPRRSGIEIKFIAWSVSKGLRGYFNWLLSCRTEYWFAFQFRIKCGHYRESSRLMFGIFFLSDAAQVSDRFSRARLMIFEAYRLAGRASFLRIRGIYVNLFCQSSLVKAARICHGSRILILASNVMQGKEVSLINKLKIWFDFYRGKRFTDHFVNT